MEQLTERMSERLEAERQTVKRETVKGEAAMPMEPAQTEQPAASVQEVEKPAGCKHYFGYLGQREKGEGIPESCLGCAKSLDCMLSDYYKSKEPIAEIKKWYPDKE